MLSNGMSPLLKRQWLSLLLLEGTWKADSWLEAVTHNMSHLLSLALS